MLAKAVTFPILAMPPLAGNLEHEAASATNAGWRGHQGNGDAVSMFALDIPGEDWNGVVLAVANGQASVVAVDALQEHLTESADHLEFTCPSWQQPLARALTSAVGHANAMVRGRFQGLGADPGRGVALTAAVLVGDWLCVAQLGDGRVYLQSKNQLEELTAGHRPGPPLGPATAVSPAIHFFRLRAGDVVLVCSAGLSRGLDGDEMGLRLQAKRPVADIAKSLVAGAAGRSGDDDMSGCLVRVGPLRGKRLPDPAEGLGAAAGPRGAPVSNPTRPATPWAWRRVGGMLGVIAVVGGLSGGWWLWPAGRKAPAPAPAPVMIVEPPPPPPVESPATVPTPNEDPPAKSLLNLLPGDSPETIQRRLMILGQRRIKDSVEAETKKAADQRTRDSLVALETSAAEQAAYERRAAEIRAERETNERREAVARAEREAVVAATALRVRNEKLVVGRNSLSGWVTSLVGTVNAGALDAPVLAAGPPGFAAFVRKNRPKLSDAKLLTVSVNEETGEATAEWVATWRTEFGTSATRSMKATATVVPDGDTWRLRAWRLTEGVP